MAEFIGIFLGDGSFGTKYQIVISYNYKCESDYAKYIQSMIRNLFGLDSRIRIRKKHGSAEVIVNSSNLVDYLRRLVKVREGENKNLFKLPSWVARNKRYKIGFLRGLFDSEGCIYKHRYYSNSKIYSYTKIAITDYCDKILSIFQRFLKSVKIDAIKYKKRIHIYSEADAKKFFTLIGSNNSKNNIRFRESIRRGTQAGLRGGLAKPVVGGNP